MKTQVIINGKPVDAVLDDEQVKAALENKKHTGLEHPGYDGIIYNINGGQYTDNERDALTPFEFSDKWLRDDWLRKQDIERRLYLAASELNSTPIDKENGGVKKYYICWDIDIEQLIICCMKAVLHLTTCFESKEAAQQTIEIVGEDDLIWLFRDFQPYIGAYAKNEEE